MQVGFCVGDSVVMNLTGGLVKGATGLPMGDVDGAGVTGLCVGPTLGSFVGRFDGLDVVASASSPMDPVAPMDPVSLAGEDVGMPVDGFAVGDCTGASVGGGSAVGEGLAMGRGPQDDALSIAAWTSGPTPSAGT